MSSSRHRGRSAARSIRSALAALALLGAADPGLPAPAAGEDAAWAGRVERLREERPALARFARRGGDWVLTGVDEARYDALLREAAREGLTPSVENALRVVVEGLARQSGALSAYGRGLLAEAVGAAATSGRSDLLWGLSRYLWELVQEPAHPYSILAQDLLSEKVRCGAASAEDRKLVEWIAGRVDPDAGERHRGTDGTVADRYGLHASADLYRVVTRGRRVAAAGHFGTVVLSDDGGRRWRTPRTGTDEPLFTVALGPAQEVWAAGRVGTVLHSEDAGRTWRRRPTPFRRHLFGALAPAQATAVLVGDFGLQLRTEDAGARWSCLPRDEDVILGRMVPADGAAFVVGEFGTLQRFHPERGPAAQGVIRGAPEEVYLYDAWFRSDGRVGVAVGLRGTVLRSEDGGAHWQSVPVETDTDLYGVGGSGELVVIAGEGGLLAVSRDGGRHFGPVRERPSPLPLLDVAFAGPERGYLVGGRGRILATEDGARSFRVVRGGGP